MFEPYLSAWSLIPDGAPVVTRAARLLPVRRHGEPAMLKLSHEPDERLGAIVMEWWDGDGAARVLAHDGDALLLERAMGAASLSAMAHTGQDDAACGILCATANRLHAPRAKSPPDLTPLTHWFRELWPAARARGGILIRSAEIAEALLADQREIVVLHGDLHHDNVLDFGARGWLAIDPKRLLGDRAFDYTTMFSNPDLCGPGIHVAARPERFAARLEQVSVLAGLERTRLLRWIAASAGLSAVWFRDDGEPAEVDEAVARMALEALAEA